ncbi:gamma-glutamyltransferase [Kineosporia rhizophila]|uniref:gamma-glutamyltransferase n=1 Tax=Kineosporia rhizophila TaxID=84633 RepID=UPI001E4A6A3B|nr:gamma-glutamyltransferase [Kineosporia rhizophila]MCE0540718.1 gamma-glutamyltransferase [Kineosporia rhizophila]
MPRRSRPSLPEAARPSARRGRTRGLAVLGALAVCAPLATSASAASAASPVEPTSGPTAAPALGTVTGLTAPESTIAGATVPATAQDPTPPEKQAEAIGYGGAVSSVDPYATKVGLEVLRKGGNAADAAIATAAALGVTEPYSAGIGGGGFLVYYSAKSKKVTTIDGRETAPKSFSPTVFQKEDGTPLDFATVVSSGLSVGVPGTPALWHKAAGKLGSRSLNELLAPAQKLAEQGFVVDETFHSQTATNAQRFAKFPATAALFLPGGKAPEIGDTFRNPDLAKAYGVLRSQGVKALYQGELGKAVVQTARAPQTTDGSQVLAGQITANDLKAYQALTRRPTVGKYKNLSVYGMPTPSSGGIAVGEALNLLEAYPGKPLSKQSDVQYLHRLAEASATAFADRNRWVGDFGGTPTQQLLSQGFADERACQLFDEQKAATRPVPFGRPDGRYGDCELPFVKQEAPRDDHGTTHLTVADKWGNVAAYTLTIEQTGGSGITVPGYGFLLNNELTDFNFAPLTAGVPDPNLPGPGKRPRSSMAPTIITKGGKPYLALGSPGGATIITTVLQVATGTLDRKLSLVDAIAAPRLSSRNGATSDAEPGITGGELGPALTGLGHSLKETAEIGAATGIQFLPGKRLVAAAEPTRRGGGSAAVVSEKPVKEKAGRK